MPDLPAPAVADRSRRKCTGPSLAGTAALDAKGTIYAGTSSEANIGPTAGYSFHRLEIRGR